MFQVGGRNMQEIRKIARRKTKAAMIRSKLRKARLFVFDERTMPQSPSVEPAWAPDFVAASTLLREYHMFMPASAIEAGRATFREALICRFEQGLHRTCS